MRAVWLQRSTVLLVAAIGVLWCTQVAAEAAISRFIQGVSPAQLYPGADQIGPLRKDLPVAPAYAGGELLGYLFLNADFANAIGYSGKPIRVLVAMDKEAVIRQATLVEHHEPIVLVGIPEERIIRVLDVYRGLDVAAIARGEVQDHEFDVVTGATVTVMVIDDSILRSAIKVARALRLGGLGPEPEHEGPRPEVDMALSEVRSWRALLEDGSVAHLKLTIGQVNAAFERLGDPQAAQRPEPGDPNDLFIDLYAALVSVPTIGRSLLGERRYANLTARLKPGQQAILLAARGRYSFKGSGYVRGGIFDRFQVIQGDTLIRFRDRDHQRLRAIAAEGAPDLDEVDLFIVPEDQKLDPAGPWRVELLVGRRTGPTTKAFLTFDLDYRLPQRYLKPLPAPEAPGGLAALFPELFGPKAPLWTKMWVAKRIELSVLVMALGLLTLIFFFQNWVVQRPRLKETLRVGFLLFTLVGIGWYANAQLSVVNILTVFNALASGFDWEYFLMEPLIFVLWGATAAGLLFWGRGPYCGWLCPFGALQELISKLAKAVRIPQWTVPWALHERLWAVKYVIFLVLFGFSLHSLGWAERLAEVEPFKTAIVLKFAREWPFVLFAVLTLAAGLFVERFYCRYICPLGAALAIPGRLRMFEWLKRYKECGSPCQRCANECMVQSIHREGQINVNECLYCLHCQELYFDDQKCPVMIQKRLRRERTAALSTADRVEVSVVLEEIRRQREAER